MAPDRRARSEVKWALGGVAWCITGHHARSLLASGEHLTRPPPTPRSLRCASILIVFLYGGPLPVRTPQSGTPCERGLLYGRPHGDAGLSAIRTRPAEKPGTIGGEWRPPAGCAAEMRIRVLERSHWRQTSALLHSLSAGPAPGGHVACGGGWCSLPVRQESFPALQIHYDGRVVNAGWCFSGCEWMGAVIVDAPRKVCRFSGSPGAPHC